jgi:nucleotide-binding universal stress UspA family protein
MIPYKNILIPIDSLHQAQVAAEKALELSDPSETCIHLVNVIRFQSFWQRIFYTEAFIKKQRYFTKRNALAERKIETIKAKIAESSPQTVVKSSIIIETTIGDQLIKYTLEHQIDLVVNTHKSARSGLNWFKKDWSEELARKASVAVLTVTKGCLNHPIKSILLSVKSYVPERKIQVALAYAKRYNAHIHLVTLLDNNDTDAKIRVDAFYLTYKILSEYGHPPQYKILQGADSDAALLRYADQIKADMILVNPNKKQRIPGIMQQKITDMLNPISALHILTLKPYLKRTI